MMLRERSRATLRSAALLAADFGAVVGAGRPRDRRRRNGAGDREVQGGLVAGARTGSLRHRCDGGPRGVRSPSVWGCR